MFQDIQQFEDEDEDLIESIHKTLLMISLPIANLKLKIVGSIRLHYLDLVIERRQVE